MAQQKIEVGQYGADARRVLDSVTPVNREVAPAMNAKYIGQVYVNTDAGTAYISIAVGSEVMANDWAQVTLV